jgi:anthranilate phosphoribosyltransferase
MGISQYIKEIGRGKDGARALSRAQAADLFGQVLDGTVTDLEIGAFCLAMRIKGETALEMAGFLDATYARLHMVPACDRPLVVLPSYNGARKLPVLTPLLALLLAREGLPVLVHGTATESTRISAQNVLLALDLPALKAIKKIANGEVAFATTELLCPGLKRLLDVRRAVGLRNPAHSLVKLMAPTSGPALVVSSYTHPEYAISMAATFALMQSNALLLRGTEGEVVADARRAPQMTGYLRGQPRLLQEAQIGPLAAVPELPKEIDADSTAAYIRDVLAGRKPVPAPIAQQVAHILHLTQHIHEPSPATV